MNQYKYLAKNVGTIFIGTFASRVLSFFLVPLYTYVLSTKDFGIYDLFNNIIFLTIPILTSNISEAVLRFGMDVAYDRKQVLSIGIRNVFFSSGIIALALLVNHIFDFNDMVDSYAIFFFFLYLFTAMLGLLGNFAKAIDKVIALSISGIISTFCIVGFNLLFLLVAKIGLVGYFLSYILGYLIASTYLAIVCRVHEYYSSSRNPQLKNEMLEYGFPLAFNSIGWWINNASDRFIIIAYCGLGANGIYSVSGKIPAILDILQSIFSSAWSISTIKENDKDNAVEFYSKIYKTFSSAVILTGSLIIVFNKALATILYQKDFYSAWKYVPFLTIASILGAITSFYGGIFTAIKDTKVFSYSTIIGSFVNVVLNFIFIPKFGPLAASITTMIGFMCIVVIRKNRLKKYFTLQFSRSKELISYIILIVQSVCYIYIKSNLILYMIQFLAFSILACIHKENIKDVVNYIINNILARRKNAI